MFGRDMPTVSFIELTAARSDEYGWRFTQAPERVARLSRIEDSNALFPITTLPNQRP